MLGFSFLLICALFAPFVTPQCGPPQCYSGCTDARPKVDFVFIIDASGSMQPVIDGVTGGLTKFASDLDDNDIDPRFALVRYGYTSDSNQRATLVTNIINNKNQNFNNLENAFEAFTVNGGHEAGHESIRMALNRANAGNLNINYRSTQNSKKVFILATDEDSDYGTLSANRYNGQTYTRDGFCRRTSSGDVDDISDSNWNNFYQPEINDLATWLLQEDASLYMFVKSPSDNTGTSYSQTCNTVYDYCNPDLQVQDADYKNFNKATTLNAMRARNPTQENSLQGKLLNGGSISRCFDVAEASDDDLIKNFFAEIVADISKCEPCYDYPCSNTNPATCLAPVNKCDCNGVKNGNWVTDPLGVCCDPNNLDCAGFCNGPHQFDPNCGVCTNGGQRPSYCKQDCANNWYIDLTTKPNAALNTQCPEPSTYLIRNPDLVDFLITNNLDPNTWPCEHYRNFGQFEGRMLCDIDTAKYQTDYGTAPANAVSDYLSRLDATTVVGNKPTVQCQAGTTRRDAPLVRDNCGQCILFEDAKPFCERDCKGVWYSTQGSPPNFVDNCNACVPQGSDVRQIDTCGQCVLSTAASDGNEDRCGVCFGGNADENECGQCFGIKGNDECGQPICEEQECGINCDGTSSNPLVKNVDECGNCVDRISVDPPIQFGRHPNCITDCAGKYYNDTTEESPNIIDECGNCVPREKVRLDSCVQDCEDQYYDSRDEQPPHVRDNCGRCIDNGSDDGNCKQDCNGTYYLGDEPPHIIDNCTRCVVPEDFKIIDGCGNCVFAADARVIDTCGDCVLPANFDADKDQCGICRSKFGYNSAQDCTPDCKGTYRLTTSDERAFVDACGMCWFSYERNMTNFFMDDCGVCHDVREGPNWNAGSGIFDSFGKECPCNTPPIQCPGYDQLKTCFDECPTDNLCPNSTETRDTCGRCPDSSMYNKGTDDCGVCCDPENGIACNKDKDQCGECFGFNRNLTDCGWCWPTPCIVDCFGVPGGGAVVGCDGVCNSTAICSFCGNGVPEGEETCDNGNKTENGVIVHNDDETCKACVKQSSNNTGQLIGGIIGGIAAVLFLALAAFFALKYAQSAGLIGSANKQVDMGASNSNPLYKSEVSVHQNPLYEN